MRSVMRRAQLLNDPQFQIIPEPIVKQFSKTSSMLKIESTTQDVKHSFLKSMSHNGPAVCAELRAEKNCIKVLNI